MEREGTVATTVTVIKLVVLGFVIACVLAFVLRNSREAVTVDWIFVGKSQVSVIGLILGSMVVGAVGWSLLWSLIKLYRRYLKKKR